MKKYFIILFIIISCKNENSYELELNQFVTDYLNFEQERINSQLKELKKISIEKPTEYLQKYENSKSLNQLINKFENEVFVNKNIDSINTLFNILKKDIINQKLISKKLFKKELNLLNGPTKNQIQKFSLLKKLKKLYYKINNRHISIASDATNSYNIRHSSISLSRLNDSILILNFYSDIAKDYSLNFNNNCITLKEIVDNHNNKLDVILKNDDVIDSYQIKTKSDTIFLAADLKTKKEFDFLISENKSFLTVGEYKTFDKNYLNKYLKLHQE